MRRHFSTVNDFARDQAAKNYGKQKERDYMTMIKKGLIKMGNASTRRQLTYKEFVESYKQYKTEKAKLLSKAK